MKAETRTLQQVLHGDRRFVVPVYQRPYVWEKERQWEPLWADIEATVIRLAEARIAGYDKGVEVAHADRSAPPHFLGAIVLEQSLTATGDVDTRLVVDGQQRLTTIQLLLRGVLDALQMSEADKPLLARIRKALMNDQEVVSASELLKLTPRLAEVEAFAFAMDTDPPQLGSSAFAAARAFFSDSAYAFLHDDEIPEDPYDSGAPPASRRASLLVATILGLVKLVVIDLDEVDDAQVIFEALNARNTPLSATDLVKNLLFLRAQAEHHDPEELYNSLWKRFDDDSDWWLGLTGIGHAQRARQDWLLGDWLIAQLGRTINVGRLYGEFRRWLDDSGAKSLEALTTLSRYADAYEALYGRRAGLTSAELVAHERINRLNITAVTPVLLWLLVQPTDVLPAAERELTFRAIESYLMRRMATKYQTRAYGQVFVDVLRAGQAVMSHPGRVIISALMDSPHGYEWPKAEDLRLAFGDGRYYGPGGINQDRLRLVLGTIDARLQTSAHRSEPIQVSYDSLQIEHVIPQGWRTQWPVTVDDAGERLLAELERERHINRIGNLTLVTGSLNLALSNDPWTAKRAGLQEHSKLELNARLIKENNWDEQRIQQRGHWLADRFEEIWPGPELQVWE